jgi:hypothetical protein
VAPKPLCTPANPPALPPSFSDLKSNNPAGFALTEPFHFIHGLVEIFIR